MLKTPQFYVLLILYLIYKTVTSNDQKVVVESSMADSSQNIFLKILQPDQINYVFRLTPGRIGHHFNATYYNAVMIATNPEHACNPLANAHEIAGKVALIIRGGCSFVDKAVNAQLAGAIAVIVYDLSQEGTQMLSMVQDESPRSVLIPCAFMSGKDGHMIVSTLDRLGYPHAFVTFPINMTGVPLHQLNLSPWTLW